MKICELDIVNNIRTYDGIHRLHANNDTILNVKEKLEGTTEKMNTVHEMWLEPLFLKKKM